jgi:hypothetical protein
MRSTDIHKPKMASEVDLTIIGKAASAKLNVLYCSGDC